MSAEAPATGLAAPPGATGLTGGTAPDGDDALVGRQVALIDLLDRLLTGGAVITGDLVISVADVDLVHVNLRAVIRSITEQSPAPW
ncbi:gas vesicle protein [Streptomyces buecherae]|uniref:gas vesicle protein n=1 Tax=Streptomyces buecherae TaxID=2763006 RepID=UPI003667E63B